MNWIIAKSKRCSPLWMGTGGFILQEGDWVRGVDEEGNGAGAGQRALDSLECDKQKPVAKWKTRWQPLVFFLLCSCTSLLIVSSLSPQHSCCLFRCLCFLCSMLLSATRNYNSHMWPTRRSGALGAGPWAVGARPFACGWLGGGQ